MSAIADHTAPGTHTTRGYRSVFRPGLFDDQVLWVTGGGSGIGRCVAHELAALGTQLDTRLPAFAASCWRASAWHGCWTVARRSWNSARWLA